jgi:hypothetical protein
MKSSVFANNIHWQVLYIALEIHPGPLLPAAGHGSFSSIFCFFCGVSFTSFRHLSIATMWWKPSRFIRYTYYLHSDITNPLKKKNNQERNWITGFVFFLKFSRSSHVWLVEPSNGCSKYWMATSWSTRPFHNSRPLIHILVPVFSFFIVILSGSSKLIEKAVQDPSYFNGLFIQSDS